MQLQRKCIFWCKKCNVKTNGNERGNQSLFCQQFDNFHKKHCLNLYSQVFWCADSKNETHFSLAQREQWYIWDIFHAIWIYLLSRQHTSLNDGQKVFTTLHLLLEKLGSDQRIHSSRHWCSNEDFIHFEWIEFDAWNGIVIE